MLVKDSNKGTIILNEQKKVNSNDGGCTVYRYDMYTYVHKVVLILQSHISRSVSATLCRSNHGNIPDYLHSDISCFRKSRKDRYNGAVLHIIGVHGH